MSHFSPVQRGKSALPAALSFALLLAWAGPGHAAPSDPLHVFAGLGYFHDDNLFRLASGHPGFAGRRSDAARTASAGLLFNKQRGRQHLKLEGKLSKVKFSHFDQLDYALETGRDVAGMPRLDQRASLAAAFVLMPALALCALLAEHIVTLVYTAAYLEAAGVMRINCLAMLGVAVEVSTLAEALVVGAAYLASYGVLLALAGLWPEARALFGRRAAIAPQAGGA
jgi:hypothetical protein